MPVHTRPAAPVALLCALTAGGQEILQAGREALSARLGALRGESAIYPFDFTDYYEEEMGAGLVKQLVCFAERVDPAVLAQVKRQTMEVEREMGREEGGKIRRRVNVDPGLLSVESLVLATTKYSGHRICIAPSLYAEVTLLYQRGGYRPLEWTYPDYRGEVVQVFLQGVRRWLMEGRGR